MKKILLNGFLFSLSFGLGLILIGFIAYKVYGALSTTTNGSPLTATNWNDIINKVNSLESTITTQASTISSLQSTVSALNSVPSGSIVAFNSASCPTGWSKANGSNGTPDLRGEFVRGRDDGKGTDSSRSIGSLQRGSLVMNLPGIIPDRIFNLIHKGDDRLGYDYPLIDSSKSYYRASTNSSITVGNWATGGIDTSFIKMTRPRNIALLYCIKN